MDEAAIRERMGLPPSPEPSEVIPPASPQVGDYGRLEWRAPVLGPDGFVTMEDREVWIEGEVLKIHRPKLDLIAEIRVDRSNYVQVGTVAGIGIEHGARFRCIPRPTGDRKGVAQSASGTISGTVTAGLGALSPPPVIDFSKGWIGLPDPDPPRPDGFAQSRIDEIKATMLATGMRGRR